MRKEKQHEIELENFNPDQAIKENKKQFSEKKYMAKLLKYAKKIGIQVSYYSLLLFYAFKSPETPKTAKLTIAGALGYLILPIDLIPDALPAVGFADDAAVIFRALYSVTSSIDDTMKYQAHTRMKKLFGKNYDMDEIDNKFKV
ncbi:hypothetical protein CIL05_03695 [Virgibacillus profundi]|uniref:DUF1232 domain-containing protein n=1 Tax=Virgibacillus profundi TaxID=2024555 RepID=A0A2A2II98_9BACI|nr:YkvA family protein [Virgibacillus profundi]PAV30835.1 hypothetical protein CIL05_03695 [Virgibacillus profundi]PXY55018.1 DUF1232 domain-containing protein [Virgibacillus profundi]